MAISVEVDLPFELRFDGDVNPGQFREDLLAQRSAGNVSMQMVLETAVVFRNDEGDFLWDTRQAASSDSTQADVVDIAVPKLRITMADNVPREELLRHLEETHAVLAAAQDNGPLGRLLPAGEWKCSEFGAGVAVCALSVEPHRDKLMNAQFNVETPLVTAHGLMRDALSSPNLTTLSNREQNQKDAMSMLRDALAFGNEVAAAYSYEKHMDQSPPSSLLEEAEDFAKIPDKNVQQVRGWASSLYHVGALAIYVASRPHVAMTDVAAVMVRHDPATLLAGLSPEAKKWIEGAGEKIRSDLDGKYRATALTSAGFEASLFLSGDQKVADLIESGISSNAEKTAGIKDLTGAVSPEALDATRSRPPLTIEVRAFGFDDRTAQNAAGIYNHLSSVAETLREKAAKVSFPNAEWVAKINQYKLRMATLPPVLPGPGSASGHQQGRPSSAAVPPGLPSQRGAQAQPPTR